MRAISPSANRVLVVAAALALALALRLPWYAPPGTDPKTTDGPIERGAFHLARVFRDLAGTRTGEAALPGGASLLLVVLAAAALLAVVLLVAAAPLVGDGLRVAGLLPVLIVAAAALRRPDGLSIHYGLLVGAVAALVLASSAWHASVVRAKAAPAFR